MTGLSTYVPIHVCRTSRRNRCSAWAKQPFILAGQACCIESSEAPVYSVRNNRRLRRQHSRRDRPRHQGGRASRRQRGGTGHFYSPVEFSNRSFDIPPNHWTYFTAQYDDAGQLPVVVNLGFKTTYISNTPTTTGARKYINVFEWQSVKSPGYGVTTPFLMPLKDMFYGIQ